MKFIRKIKEKIAVGGQVFGMYITIADSCVSEMAGFAGYDFVWICTEHTAFDKQEILHHIMAAQSAGAAAFVRMKGNDPTEVKAILDMGADAILFPMIENAEQAERAVRSCMYPPHGMRGGGPVRAIRYGIDNELEYQATADNDIWKVIIVETEEGYRNLDEIMAVKNIDSIFIGSWDLRLSLARLPEPERTARFNEILADMAKRLKEKGYIFGVGSNSDIHFVSSLVEKGFSWFFVGNDARLLCSPMVENLKNLRSVFK